MKVIKATQQMLETRTLVLGFQGENLRTQLRIDCASTFAEYPNATPALAIKPPTGETYPVFVNRDGTEVVWDIVANNLALKGDGELQLTFYKDNVIAKTSIGHITVNRSLQIDGEMPDVVATWIENANRKLAEVDAQIVELEGMVDTATDAAERAEQSASTASTKAEQAAESAATATAKATEATNAAGTATAKAAEAQTAAQTATAKATAAAESERIATAKAGDATTAAGTATTKATEATESAQTATEKAGDASASATAAHASEINAAESADDALSAEVGANAAKRAAETSATQAGTSEQNAGTAAQTATQKAAEATQSATDAATFAGTATTKAEEATEAAQAASDAKTAVEQTAEQLADSLEQIEQNTQDIAELDERKANVDGYYPDMTVGNAEQLNSSKFVENSEPYTLRTSGGSSDIGNREYLDAVVGGTVALNQKLKRFTDRAETTTSGITYSRSDGVISVSGALTPGEYYTELYAYPGIPVQAEHVYLITFRNKSSTSETVFRVVQAGGNVPYAETSNAETYHMTKATKNGNLNMYVRAMGKTEFTATIYPMELFDLTTMFGTAVADYIYSLEQANAGAGVEYFRSWFPNDYYEYNVGELRHVEGLQSHDMVGFNAFDKSDIKTGVYISDDDGNERTSTGAISTGWIPVIGGSTYYIKHDATSGNWGAWYDVNKNYISKINGTGIKTAPVNARFMRFTVKNYPSSTGNPDTLCISLSHNGSRNGEYEPYEKHSYPLDSSVILRGIPKVGANGVYWDGDRYLPDGTVERRYGVVDLGTLTWGDNLNKCWVTNTIPDIKPVTDSSYTNRQQGVICTKYSADTQFAISGTAMTDKTWLRTATVFAVKDTAYENAAAFKASLSGVLLVYELATPTIETAQPYHSTQWVSDWGTEEFVSTGIVPVGTETRYPANLRDKLQHLPDAASGNGSYLITQTDGQMTLTPFPAPPSSAGNYVLKATVTGGVATYTWEVAT